MDILYSLYIKMGYSFNEQYKLFLCIYHFLLSFIEVARVPLGESEGVYCFQKLQKTSFMRPINS